MSNVSLNTGEIIEYANQLSTISSNIETYINQVDKIIDNVPEAWNSENSRIYSDQLLQFKNTHLNKIVNYMNSVSTTLHKTGETVSNTQEDVNVKIKRLPEDGALTNVGLSASSYVSQGVTRTNPDKNNLDLVNDNTNDKIDKISDNNKIDESVNNESVVANSDNQKINLDKISATADDAKNGKYIDKSKLSEGVWNDPNLKLVDREDGTQQVVRDGVVIGFTTKEESNNYVDNNVWKSNVEDTNKNVNNNSNTTINTVTNTTTTNINNDVKPKVPTVNDYINDGYVLQPKATRITDVGPKRNVVVDVYMNKENKIIRVERDTGRVIN